MSRRFRRASVIVEESTRAPNYVKMNKYNLNELFTNVPKFDAPIMNFSSPQKNVAKGRNFSMIAKTMI
jgi:hypothetical protein